MSHHLLSTLYRPREGKPYEDAVAGSRAEGRGAGAAGWIEMWQAGIGAGVLRRRRREVLRFCRDGERPRLVLVSTPQMTPNGIMRIIFPAGMSRALAGAAAESQRTPGMRINMKAKVA